MSSVVAVAGVAVRLSIAGVAVGFSMTSVVAMAGMTVGLSVASVARRSLIVYETTLARRPGGASVTGSIVVVDAVGSLVCIGVKKVMGSGTVSSTVGSHGGSDANMGPSTRAVAYLRLTKTEVVRTMVGSLTITVKRDHSSSEESKNVRLHSISLYIAFLPLFYNSDL